MSRKTNFKLYRVWDGIIQRCYNPYAKNYRNYGGRGICVCDEWKHYEAFRDWALSNGYKESLSIDRIDPNGNYCPENCRWATVYQQANNKRTSKRITYNGKTGTVREFADEYNISYSCLYTRLKNGWSVETALLTPSKTNRKPTNAQKIRAMSDEELASVLIQFAELENKIGFCQNLPECDALLDTDDGIPEARCQKCLLKWLQQPAEDKPVRG